MAPLQPSHRPRTPVCGPVRGKPSPGAIRQVPLSSSLEGLAREIKGLNPDRLVSYFRLLVPVVLEPVAPDLGSSLVTDQPVVFGPLSRYLGSDRTAICHDFTPFRPPEPVPSNDSNAAGGADGSDFSGKPACVLYRCVNGKGHPFA